MKVTVLTASTWNNKSRVKFLGETSQGLMIAIVPTTIVVTNMEPPNNEPSPTSTSFSPLNAVREEKMSGAPFPNARKVIPAMSYGMPILVHMPANVGEK